MNFERSGEQTMLVETAKDIVDEYGESYFREKRLADEEPEEFVEDLADAGFFGIPIPVEYGGQGMGMLDLVYAIEAIAEAGGWDAVAKFTLNTVFGGVVLSKFGTEEQKEEYLPKIADGEMDWALGVTEANTGSNMLNTQTFAERDGDEFVINGEKAFNSGLDQADGYTLLTRTKTMEESDRRTDGLTVFLVDPDADGIEYEPVDLDIYWPAGENTFTVHIDDLRVHESQAIGEIHGGFAPIFEVLNPERISTAAEHLGRGWWVLDKAVQRAKDREVWGEPIGAHQAIQHPLAQSYVDMKSASTMVKRAAWAYDQGQDNVGELSNIGHLQAGNAAFEAADNAVETFGGGSAVADYGIAAVWSLARHQQIAPVTDHMKLNFIANNVLDLPRSYGR
ncbi:acyl-CoA dehydrogenase family protein [Halorarius halobius]|uniref:acyl-CoA dehydrogenase family protein n=1 Tax=Halorarius halobius TaxID=2962671 RepID=UPI0020CE4D50|nr:acyl-CoA dehydrogenase family protein [Halorarius halobius]